jgi:hypothetical protein
MMLPVAILALFCQDNEPKSLLVPVVNGKRTVTVTALNINRGDRYPGIIQLKGNVEIKTPVCIPAGKKGKTVCAGEMVLRADEAQFHEDSGRIEAQGNVSVTPLHYHEK